MRSNVEYITKRGTSHPIGIGVIQTQKIQNLQEELAVVQVDQANGAEIIGGSVPVLIPGTITTDGTTLTQELTQTMFQQWTAAQIAGTPTPKTNKC